MAYTVAATYILKMPSHFDRIFHYYIPQELSKTITKGSLVTVPFGGGNRHVSALVSEVIAVDSIEGLKPVIDTSSITLTDEEYGLVFFLREYTFCSVGDAVRCVVPHSFLTQTNRVFSVTDKTVEKDAINFKAMIVYSFILERGNPTLKNLKEEYGNDVIELLDSLISLGYIKEHTEVVASENIKTLSVFDLTFLPHEVDQMIAKHKIRSDKQCAILNYIAEHGSSSIDVLRQELSITAAQLRKLCEKKLLKENKEEAYRLPYRTPKKTNDPPLTDCQKKAFSSIESKLLSDKPEAILLHGITGSGKTRVIKEAIDRVISCGKQVILLVPEISLTPQTVNAFCSYYQNRVAVIHSSLSSGEKYDAWRRIKRNEVDLCIGTRSAIFAPFTNLGMIVMDEEHEHTYKSEQSPRYHTIDIARYRVAHHNATLLLASATPSVESYQKAVSGAYHLVEMHERASGGELPETLITDLRADAKSGRASPIGLVLKDALTENLHANEQSIFFINRRGYNNFLNCTMCGHVITCPHCSVSLTHHMKNRKSTLVCHYCGYMHPIPTHCPECGSDAFSFIGFGTQFAEESIIEEFPEARVLRMDADTTAPKFSYDKMLSDFRSEKSDILLGTQMVTKGHDFPNVTLVGILLADTSLYLDDYRATERTFQLVTQVIGRAGRARKKGRAIIQTYNPNHHALALAATQDYKAFFKEEIAMRKALVFPPFCDMVLITVSSQDEVFLQKAVIEAESTLSRLQASEFQDVKLIVYGPFEAPIYKIKETYRMRFVIKCKSNKRTRALLRAVLTQTMQKHGKKASISIDINPNTI
ncbi:MAG: primosomal protein N' [Clostridia bacterium]|nr:primosomal protein N' [Clostridia bacterium]